MSSRLYKVIVNRQVLTEPVGTYLHKQNVPKQCFFFEWTLFVSLWWLLQPTGERDMHCAIFYDRLLIGRPTKTTTGIAKLSRVKAPVVDQLGLIVDHMIMKKTYFLSSYFPIYWSIKGASSTTGASILLTFIYAQSDTHFWIRTEWIALTRPILCT